MTTKQWIGEIPYELITPIELSLFEEANLNADRQIVELPLSSSTTNQSLYYMFWSYKQDEIRNHTRLSG